MYLSYEWLKDFLDLSAIPALELADKMSRSGIEIEGVENYGTDLMNLVVGEVVECVPHENSDRLNVTKVNVGDNQLRQIVCGAPNVYKGAKVIVALEGATLPNNIKIKKSKLRGVVSEGMLCALQELGFNESVIPKKYADGLFLLPQDAPIGVNAVEYLQLDDPILELSITPNRADALSMRGSAYEVAAVTNQVLTLLENRLGTVAQTNDLLSAVNLKVANPTLSPRYQLHVIKNITIKESPLWLQMRLMKAGIRPLNNIVDITNYFLLLYGQPMHAFDYDKLISKEISVDTAKDGQVFVTLDGVERTLTDTDIVIKSGETPIALAGVMGGMDSEVTEQTTTILLETAVFEPQAVRQTSNKFNLRSESSARFEKGINLATIDEAGFAAAHLMAILGEGEVEDDICEFNELHTEEKSITMAFTEIEKRLGIQVSEDELATIFKRLGFEYESKGEQFIVTVPTRRWDITIEADILEEIARIYGYDRIPTTLPTVPSMPGQLSVRQHLVRQSRTIVEGMGLNQVISYVLTSPKEAEQIKTEMPLVKLALPMSEDRSVLRQSLFPAMMEIAKYNHARQNQPLAFYELGKVFYGQDETPLPIEEEHLAILISGQQLDTEWYQSAVDYDFYTLKGMLENYFEALRITEAISYEATSDYEVLHPGRTGIVRLANEKIGYFGQVHPLVAKEYDLPNNTFFAELNFDIVLNYHRQALVQTPIPKYPTTSRDLALLVPKSLSQQSLVDIIRSQGGADLVDVQLFDRFIDLKIGEDNQSLAYRLTFQNPNKTLTDEEVLTAMNKITKGLSAVEGLEIR